MFPLRQSFRNSGIGIGQVFLLSIGLLVISLLTDTRQVWGQSMLRPFLTISETYTPNPASSAKGKEGRSDYITTISPGLVLSKKTSLTTVSGSYSLNIQRFGRRSELDTVTHLLNLSLNKVLTQKTGLSLSERFAFTPDSVEATEGGVLVERTDIYSNGISLSINHTINPKWSFGIGVRDSATEFEDPNRVDSRRDSVFTNIGHLWSKRTTLTLGYNLSRFSFNRDESVVFTHSLVTGFNHAFTPSFTFNGSAGVDYNSETEEFNFVTGGDLGFTRKTTNTNLKVAYNRSISTSTGLAAETTITQSLNLGLNRKLTKFVSLSVKGKLSETRNDSASIDITSYNIGINGTYKINSWLDTSLSFSRFKQLSGGQTGDDRKRDTATFTITIHPAGWNL